MIDDGKITKQDLDITELKIDSAWLKKEVCEIKTQVFNHIPTKIDEIKSQLFYGFTIGTASVIIAQIILKFFV